MVGPDRDAFDRFLPRRFQQYLHSRRKPYRRYRSIYHTRLSGLFRTGLCRQFCGAACGAYEYTIEYIRSQNKQADRYVQHHLARIRIDVETLEMWLAKVAHQLSGGNYSAGWMDGSKLRHLAEVLAEDSVKRCIRICGARCLNRPSRLERLYRDLSVYTLHDNQDHVLANIGRILLDLPAADSFFGA